MRGSHLFNLLRACKQHSFVLAVLLVSLSSWSLSVEAENSITVKSGQTIIKLMRQVYPDQRSRWPTLMRELVQSNPSAFENGDPRTLKVGAVITLPEQSTAKTKKLKRRRAASVSSVVGSVTLFDDKKKNIELKSGSNIYIGDQLLTSDSGAVTLNFVDGAVIKLRCNSLLNINQYKMRTRGSQSELTLLKGSLHHETGRIGKRSGDKTILKTPVGDVLATDAEYGVRVHQSKACAKQADVENDGLFVAVLSGETLIKSDGGEMDVSSGDALAIVERSAAPVSVNAFAGMVFGDKVVEKVVAIKSQPYTKAKKALTETAEPEAIDNGIPIWWMIAGALILGVSF